MSSERMRKFSDSANEKPRSRNALPLEGRSIRIAMSSSLSPLARDLDGPQRPAVATLADAAA